MKRLYTIIMLLFAVVLSSTAQEFKTDTITINEVVITSKYKAPVSLCGQTLPLRRIPQSISVINPIRIQELNITTIDQAMQQVTGVTTIANDNMRSQYKSRGYGMSIMTDGLPAYNSLAVSQQFDLAFFEQIEVLRGVSSILQGVPDGQSLGGVINLVRKKTKKDLGLSTYVSAGSWNNYRIEADLNAPITKDGKLRSRWVSFLNYREFFYERSKMDKEGLYGILEWDATKSTLISLSYAYQHAYGDVLYNGLPAQRATSDDQSRKHLDVPRSFNPTPDWDYTKWNTHEIMFSIEQQLAENWKMVAKAGVKHQEQENKYGFAGTVTTETNMSNYLRGYNDQFLPRIVSSVDFSGRFKLFNRTHNLFAGINFENFVDDKKYLSAYYNAEWGNHYNVPDFEVPYDKLNSSKMRVRQGGIYAQLRLWVLKNMMVNIGTRMSSVYASMYSHQSEEWNNVLKDVCKFTPFASIIYDPIQSLTLYGNFSTIFVPQTEKREDGSILKPRTGYQFELGAKSGFFNGKLTTNLSAFYMMDKNRAYKVSPAPAYINGGQVDNTGVELEVDAFPIGGWEISAGYAWLHTQITKSADGDQGLAFSPVEPEHSFRFATAYRFYTGVMNGFAVGVNLHAFSRSYASVLTPERDQKPYALLNAFVSYTFNKHIAVFFNCNNITDCIYYSRLGGNGDFFGDPRNFTLSLRCNF